MKRRHNRHIQSRQQRQHVRAGIATENAELMLQRYRIELTTIQDFSSVSVVLQFLIVDLDADDWWVVVGLTAVIHCNDNRLRAWA